MQEKTLKDYCVSKREELKTIAEDVKLFLDSLGHTENREIGANLMLTYIHLEDASIRLGKTIQAFDGGISIYDKDQPERNLNNEVPKN